MKKTMILALTVAILVFALSPVAYAQGKGYPGKGITILVPSAPGGGIDFIIRLVAENLKKEWKVPIDIINKTAAGGAIALEEVAHARKDGLTLFGGLVSTPGTLTHVNPGGSVNLFRDFVPIACFRQHNVNLISVRSDSDFKSVEDVLNFARKNPGKLIYASPAVGTDPYLEVAGLKGYTKLDFVHLPFSNVTENINSLLGGHARRFPGHPRQHCRPIPLSQAGS